MARGIDYFRKHGLAALLVEAKSYLFSKARAFTIRLHGRHTLSIGTTQVTFPSSSTAFVEQNLERFQYERQQIADMLHEIRQGDIVYDIGANTGLFTLFAAHHCTDGQVIAFEPYPLNNDLLAREIHQNNIGNAEVFGIALSDQDGLIRLTIPRYPEVGYGSAALGAKPTKGSEQSIIVSAYKGDTLIADGATPQPNVIKIDVEGAESLVINGMKRALSADACRVVYCEVHTKAVNHRPSIDDFNMTMADFENKFEKFGYSVERLQERESEIVLKASRGEAP